MGQQLRHPDLGCLFLFPRGNMQKKVEKAIFIPDPHLPENDPIVTQIIFAITEWFQPDRCFVMGDLLDAKTVSKYAKDPNHPFTMQDEFDLVSAFFKDVRRTVGPDCDVTWLMGNHEARWRKYLTSICPEIQDLRVLQMRNLVDLEQSIDMVPYNQGINYRGVHVEHGDIVSKDSGQTAHRLMKERFGSVIHGHTHRLGQVYKRTVNGEFFGVECGTMQKKDVSYATSATNWQWGCAVSYWMEGWKEPKVDIIHIGEDYSCAYGGVIFS
jgi:UDP-2,3-diacylglucosamine pyrophosphatase LpxH